MAEDAGSPLSQNVVMLGAASPSIPLRPESLIDAVKRLVPKKTVDINMKAFEIGQGIWREMLMRRMLGVFDYDTIYLGDALELMPGIPDGVVDLIVTDPPFRNRF